VIDVPTRDLLHACVRRESRSLFQYVREVPLWVGPVDRPALARLKNLATAEQTATDNLGRYLQRRQAGLGHLGAFPSGFTTVNDAALHYLMPQLIAEQRTAATALEADLAQVTDADARTHVAELLRLKRQHLPELEALTSQPHTVWK
jgi:hypothetical protein